MNKSVFRIIPEVVRGRALWFDLHSSDLLISNQIGSLDD